MKGFTLRLSLVASLLVMFSLVGALPGQSDNSKHQFNPQSEDRARKGPARPGVRQLSYRSPGANHKLMVPADDADIEQRISDHEELDRLLGELRGSVAAVVRMYHLEGKTYQAISHVVGLPENSGGPMLSRARSQMRRHAGADQPTA